MDDRIGTQQEKDSAQSVAEAVGTARGETDLPLLKPVIGEIYRIKISKPKGGPVYLWGKGYVQEADRAAQWVFHCVDPASNKYILCTAKAPQPSYNPVGSVLYGDKNDLWIHAAFATEPHLLDVHTVWQLEDAGNGKFRLWCYGRSLYVVADFNQTQFVLGDKKSDGSDLFELEKVGEYSEVINLRKYPPKTFQTPELTSMDQPPIYTDQEIAGEVAVPWFLVAKDGDRDDQWRAMNTPYYIVRRWSRWYSKDWETLKRTETRQHQWSITWGVSQEDASQIDQNLNISVSAEAGLDISGFSAKVSTSVSYGLNIKTSQRTSRSYSETKSGNYQIGPVNDGDMAVCDFYRQDQYRFYRAEGQEVREFPVTVPGTSAGRTYVKKQ
ncbi:hypothetical protein OG196_01120 [Kitasatospora purpeofusca]|uniref:hypothetical protein n=1 Tax=Kitasatospora purpeofusca TaxID=67352 RepID=UPI002E0FB3BC|nr:hypothetical protein OG715_00555 [Kitasatospora purpeofusca]WSR37802.1 hypothetical protein OG196_01120 [Kitasatospora purpeofusca]